MGLDTSKPDSLIEFGLSAFRTLRKWGSIERRPLDEVKPLLQERFERAPLHVF